MKLIRPYRCAALALAACLAAAVDAATVGRPQGPALIGRPLDLVVPLVLEGAGDAAPECAEADVFYGDQRVAPGSVSTELQAGPRGPTVRIRAMPAINEPVITVYLQLGCGSRFTRRIVLLTEPDPAAEQSRPLPAGARTEAAEAAANSAPLNLSMSRGLPSVQPAAGAAEAPKPSAPKRKPAAKPKSAAPAPAQAAAPSQAARAGGQAAVAPAPSAGPAAAPRDKLKLEAPIGLGEPSPSSEEALRQAARLQAIERDLGDMRQFLQRNDATMLQLHAQLVRAENERYSNPLVYVLLALVAVMAGFMAYLWRQTARMQEAAAANWWRDPAGDREPRRPRPGAEAAPVVARPAPLSRPGDDDDDAPGKPRSRLVSQAPEPLEPVPHEPAQPPTMHAPLHVSARTDGDFQPSQTGTRALKAEELHDVQQEADFFSSLGEYDRAIDVLRSHIQANPETSAVAWLDLVEIYHRLGRREDFDWVRREFQRRFNAKVPEFDSYSLENAGIEAYDNAMQRIIALWPARRVLDVIEESIFRGPSKDGAQAFSLQAYRELLLLHHIGQQVLSDSASHSGFHEEASEMVGGNSDFGAEGFSHTSIHPLSTGLAGKDEAEGQGGAVLDLDLSLDEPAAAPASGAMLDFDLPEIDPALAAPSRGPRE